MKGLVVIIMAAAMCTICGRPDTPKAKSSAHYTQQAIQQSSVYGQSSSNFKFNLFS